MNSLLRLHLSIVDVVPRYCFGLDLPVSLAGPESGGSPHRSPPRQESDGIGRATRLRDGGSSNGGSCFRCAPLPAKGERSLLLSTLPPRTCPLRRGRRIPGLIFAGP